MRTLLPGGSQLVSGSANHTHNSEQNNTEDTDNTMQGTLDSFSQVSHSMGDGGHRNAGSTPPSLYSLSSSTAKYHCFMSAQTSLFGSGLDLTPPLPLHQPACLD